MKKQNKEINIFKTIFASAWIYLLEFFLCINAMLYSRDRLLVATSLRELFFWVTIMVIFGIAFTVILPKSTFYFYKKDKTQPTKERKR